MAESTKINPPLEPALHDDLTFLEQVRVFIKDDNFVYLGEGKDVLIDKHLVPIFDIREANYAMISKVHLDNAYTLLGNSAGVIKRLMRIINNLTMDSNKEDKERKK